MFYLKLKCHENICKNICLFFRATGLIEYNFHCFQRAIQEVFDLRNKGTATGSGAGQLGHLTLSGEHPQVNGLGEAMALESNQPT